MKLPFVKQETTKDCAAASLSMIIKYHRGNININDLETMLKTNKKGTTAYNLITAANELGFDSFGAQYDGINKLEGVFLPAIAHLKIENTYYHYVVVYKIDFKNKFLVIGDPASAIKKISFLDFEKDWTKVLIILSPIKNIPYIKEQSIIDFMFIYFKKNIKPIGYIFTYALISTILVIITSFYLQMMLSTINLFNAKEHLMFLFTIYLVVYLFKVATDYLKIKIIIYFGSKIELDLTIDSISKIIHLPYSFFDNHTVGELASKIYDLEIVKSFFTKVVLTTIINVILSLVAFITLYLINDKLFILGIISILFYVMVMIIFNKIMHLKIIHNQEVRSISNSYLIELLTNYETINNLSINNTILNKFVNKYQNSISKKRELDKIYNIEYHVKELFSNIIYLSVIYFGIILILDNKLSTGSLITFSIVFNYFINPFRELVDMFINIKESKSAFNRLYSITNKKVDISVNHRVSGDIKINKLNYKYDNTIILNNLSLHIKKGQKVLITGVSGSGKSTLLKLLFKYYPVKTGSILIDDMDINDIYIKDDIVLITQNETLFTDTFISNLNIASNANTKKIRRVINMCHLKDVINNHNGLNAIILEGGINLSGGERQRIILARALLKETKILLIDEGMSELDKLLERKITENIFNYHHDKTIVVISHSLDNADLYDQVYKMESGRLNEFNYAK